MSFTEKQQATLLEHVTRYSSGLMNGIYRSSSEEDYADLRKSIVKQENFSELLSILEKGTSDKLGNRRQIALELSAFGVAPDSFPDSFLSKETKEALKKNQESIVAERLEKMADASSLPSLRKDLPWMFEPRFVAVLDKKATEFAASGNVGMVMAFRELGAVGKTNEEEYAKAVLSSNDMRTYFSANVEKSALSPTLLAGLSAPAKGKSLAAGDVSLAALKGDEDIASHKSVSRQPVQKQKSVPSLDSSSEQGLRKFSSEVLLAARTGDQSRLVQLLSSKDVKSPRMEPVMDAILFDAMKRGDASSAMSIIKNSSARGGYFTKEMSSELVGSPAAAVFEVASREETNADAKANMEKRAVWLRHQDACKRSTVKSAESVVPAVMQIGQTVQTQAKQNVAIAKQEISSVVQQRDDSSSVFKNPSQISPEALKKLSSNVQQNNVPSGTVSQPNATSSSVFKNPSQISPEALKKLSEHFSNNNPQFKP